MSVIEGIHGFCSCRSDGIPAAVRVRAVAELSVVVATGLVMQLIFVRLLDGDGWTWLNAALQLSLPMLGALTLRAIAGPRIYAAAAILTAGLVASAMFVEPSEWVRSSGSNAFVAIGMVWVLGSDPRASTKSVIIGASILALAMAAARVI